MNAGFTTFPTGIQCSTGHPWISHYYSCTVIKNRILTQWNCFPCNITEFCWVIFAFIKDSKSYSCALCVNYTQLWHFEQHFTFCVTWQWGRDVHAAFKCYGKPDNSLKIVTMWWLCVLKSKLRTQRQHWSVIFCTTSCQVHYSLNTFSRFPQQFLFFLFSRTCFDGFTIGPKHSMTQQRKWRVVEIVFVASVAAEKERRGHPRNW